MPSKGTPLLTSKLSKSSLYLTATLRIGSSTTSNSYRVLLLLEICRIKRFATWRPGSSSAFRSVIVHSRIRATDGAEFFLPLSVGLRGFPMIFAETVLAGAPDPGTSPEVMSTPAGYYIGYRDEDGLPYSRETDYFADQQSAASALTAFVAALQTSPDQAKLLPFVRR
jgi:hypothetical protein